MTETDAVVFVVDDDAPMRESLKNLIRSVGLRAEGLICRGERVRPGWKSPTVKIHRLQVIEKMGAGSLAELVRIADRLGI